MREAIYRKLGFFLFFLLLSPVLTFSQTALVNINNANTAELQTLNGIGAVKAQAIIDYRNAHGPFQKIEDIKNVSGIGEATYSNIKDFITVGVPSISEEEATSSTTPNASAHYVPDAFRLPKKNEVPVSLSAGRDRIGSVGSPLEFTVETDLTYTKGSIFTWNFGDGGSKDGDVVVYTYDYPGDYVVMLSALTPQGRAIARTRVKIVDADILLVSATPERVELKNNSKYEINLFGKGLIQGNKIYLFPQDTIILPGQNIFFSSKITGLKPRGIHEVSILTVGESRNEFEIRAKAEDYKAKRIAEINESLAVLETRMAHLSSAKLAAGPVLEKPDDFPQPALAIEAAQEERIVETGGWLRLLKRFFLRRD